MLLTCFVFYAGQLANPFVIGDCYMTHFFAVEEGGVGELYDVVRLFDVVDLLCILTKSWSSSQTFAVGHCYLYNFFGVVGAREWER